MDEQSFLDRLRECGDDIVLLREYAAWLTARKDDRGNHLAAELDVYDAEIRLANAAGELADFRKRRPQDFEWLNTVLPMITKVPLDGIFYSSREPDSPPYVRPGMFCSRDTVVGIIEAQKVFHHVAAGHNGVVSDIFVENGASVSAGDLLVKIIRPQNPHDTGFGS
ncbi:acetyl-CoA carboxylase biotin carboxyl carrier protein [Fuerstiella marisgermanici]|uniref:Biotin carboxyl carrier protein of acetyl-CoA carboxylase n=1 Tax=Fuerstiella marisgermanici TaxID=1891926 RepID=A0A1P8WF89_9PLAN|nr:biotin/lipoyl-containing protein [Fuerstiella marisgermanici]APZ92732.1 Biotin carboxyl carrier protein of acetyl-CoA carboxylase [Fuerstiella marisgermanici]